MSDVLTELIIPAVNVDAPLDTEYFTRYDGRRSVEKDVLLVDAVMAGGSTPTYFPSYKIKGVGCFVDGRVSTHCSAQKAFEEARCRFKKRTDEIFLLSLGTGKHVSELFEVNMPKNRLSWMHCNTANHLTLSQTNKANAHLHSELGKSYRRFEVFLEHDIPLDGVEYLTDLCDIGSEFIECKHDEINEIVEILLN